MKPQRKTVDDRSSMITYYMDVLEIMTVAVLGKHGEDPLQPAVARCHGQHFKSDIPIRTCLLSSASTHNLL